MFQAISFFLTQQLKRHTVAVIYLAAGCFWGSQAYFKQIDGVISTEVGYANGNGDSVSYEEVSSGSGHAEVVKLTYDPGKLPLYEVLMHYMRIVDPYSVNRQGNDQGIQYRSGIYFESNDDKTREQVERFITHFETLANKKTAIEVSAIKNYVPAENYHQDYLTKTPGGYCHVNLQLAKEPLYPSPGIAGEDLRKRIGDLAYRVTQEAATEPEFYDFRTQAGLVQSGDDGSVFVNIRLAELRTNDVIFESDDPDWQAPERETTIALEEAYQGKMSLQLGAYEADAVR